MRGRWSLVLFPYRYLMERFAGHKFGGERPRYNRCKRISGLCIGTCCKVVDLALMS